MSDFHSLAEPLILLPSGLGHSAAGEAGCCGLLLPQKTQRPVGQRLCLASEDLSSSCAGVRSQSPDQWWCVVYRVARMLRGSGAACTERLSCGHRVQLGNPPLKLVYRGREDSLLSVPQQCTAAHTFNILGPWTAILLGSGPHFFIFMTFILLVSPCPPSSLRQL